MTLSWLVHHGDTEDTENRQRNSVHSVANTDNLAIEAALPSFEIGHDRSGELVEIAKPAAQNTIKVRSTALRINLLA